MHVDFVAILNEGERAVRRGAAFVALGHRSWSDDSIASVKIDAPMALQLLPDPLPPDLASNVRSAYCSKARPRSS